MLLMRVQVSPPSVDLYRPPYWWPSGPCWSWAFSRWPPRVVMYGRPGVPPPPPPPPAPTAPAAAAATAGVAGQGQLDLVLLARADVLHLDLLTRPLGGDGLVQVAHGADLFAAEVDDDVADAQPRRAGRAFGHEVGDQGA